MAARKKARSSRTKDPVWAKASDAELLDMRFCDLGLSFETSGLQGAVDQLHAELEAAGIPFKPHVWLSNEWFSPDGVPGIAAPFYLAHPRLRRLERKQVLDVEGGTKASCMAILRHEAGHAIDTAYGLRRRRDWGRVFGSPASPYPETYSPRPQSRKYVLHLDGWYAQSHPIEDFAETFAVWLTPRKRWRTEYASWGALAKLEYVDEVLAEVVEGRLKKRSRAKIDPVHRMRMTLREHYKEKRERYGVDLADFYDLHLRQLFRPAVRGRRAMKADTFLRTHGPELRTMVSQATGFHPYSVDQFLKEMRVRCRARDLTLRFAQRETKLRTGILLTTLVMRTLTRGGYRVTL